MPLLQASILILVAIGGTAVVFTRNPVHQAIVVSFYGLLLAVLFMLYMAPDVAIAQIVVGEVALPLMILLALSKTHKSRPEEPHDEQTH